jgi:hypothetical protein
MRNSAFEAREGRGPSLGDVLQNPVFANLVRLFLVLIFALGGYIWKTEMAHVNKALDDIKTSVSESQQRQWSEVHDMRRQVSQLNQDVLQILYRSNELLSELARERSKRP